MDIVNIILVLAGIVCLLLAALKKDFTQFSPGWLGLTLLAVVEFLRIVVVR